MEGKAALFKQFANVDAWPVCLDTQDTEEIIRIVKALAPVYGGVNLEDIAAPRCFEIENRLREELDIPVFHDDQHGTAIVTLAALVNALRVVDKKLADVRIVVSGVGAAGSAIIQLLKAQGARHIIAAGRSGAIHSGEKYDDEHRTWIAANTNEEGFSGTLHEALKGADVFIGVSAPNVIGEEQVASMAEDAIVFAMANPTPEIDPVIASRHAAVVATGRSDFPNQINNVLAFPGFFRGLLDAGRIGHHPGDAGGRRGGDRQPGGRRRAECELHHPQRLRPPRGRRCRRGGSQRGTCGSGCPDRTRSTRYCCGARGRGSRQRLNQPWKGPTMAITVTDPRPIERAEEILTPKALAFVEELHQRFAGTRGELLTARAVKREQVARTGRLDFLPETKDVRDGDWKVAPAPAALQDRRVEMTGPASPAKMAINALNSGAKVWLADLEDASTPTWANVIDADPQPPRRRRRNPGLHLPRGQGIPPPHRRPAGRRGGPPPRLAHGRSGTC